MKNERDFYVTVTAEHIELEGRGGKYLCKHDELDQLISSLQNAKESASLIQTMQHVAVKPSNVVKLPITRSHLTRIK